MDIQKKLIKYNFSSGNDVKYIVVHDTGNSSRGANADAHYRYFNGGDRQASAHYFIDENQIIQTVEDFNAAWHCGDGNGKYGITNHNSIGIEICINADGNYNKAVSNAIELVKFKMKQYSIPIERVVRHYDASRKNCPASMSANGWEKWNWFKNQLINADKGSKPSENNLKPGESIGKVIAESGVNIRDGAGTEYSKLGALANGTEVRIGFSKKGSDGYTWYNIYFGDHGGWVRGDLIQIIYSQPIEEQQKSSVMYRVILDGNQVEALSYQDKAEEAVRAAVDSGKAKSGKVQRNTDGVDIFFYPAPQTTVDYEKELCRIIVNGNNLIALTGKTKCIIWAKDNYEGHIKIQCVKDSVFVAEFDNTLKKPEPPVDPPKPPAESEKPKEPEVNKTLIVGTAVLTKGQMLKYLLDNNNEPKLTVSAEELVSYFLDEGDAEGIRGDIAFCQAIKETGFFKYGGQVLPEQNNYAGIGATNNSPVGKGAWFKTAREGVRAQIQHLKAYASIEPLKNECVDPRFNLVKRGVAPAWEDLNGRWAVPGEGYGQDILKIFERIRNITIDKAEEDHPEAPGQKEDKEKESLIKTVLKLIIDLLKKLLNK